jgi:hypothetical protein
MVDIDKELIMLPFPPSSTYKEAPDAGVNPETS